MDQAKLRERWEDLTLGSDNSVKLALGTAQFGLPYGISNQSGQVSRLEAGAMLQLATANGIDTLDTAIAYGESEICLGEVGTQDFKLITKLPAVPNDCADINDWVQLQFAASLSRLGVPAVDGLLLHSARQLLGPNGKGIFQALQWLKNSGEVKKIGISIYAPSELDAIIKLFSVDLVQAPLNLVDRRLLTSGWLQRLHAEGVEIHTRSAFLQGLLLMPRGAIPAQFAPWNAVWGKWHNWLANHDVCAVQASLAYPLSFPEIDRVVVGADSVNQLAQIIRAVNRVPLIDLPELQSDDEDLINPANWTKS